MGLPVRLDPQIDQHNQPNRIERRSAVTVLLALILLLGLGLRVVEAWDGRSPVYDAAAYATIAANLDHGEGFSLSRDATQLASNYSPGLPLLVAGLYELSGGVHERTARVVLALLGALAIFFTFLIGRRLSGPTAGLVGAAAIAIYPALLEYQGMLMGEPLAATLLSGAVFAAIWASDLGRGVQARARWMLPGALFGALALVRPEYLGVAVLAAVAVVLASAMRWELRPQRATGVEWRASVLQGAVFLAGVAIVVAPWTIRNAVALDRFVPVSTGGGQVLFAGTYLPSDGDPERVGAEVVERHPQLFGPDALQRLRLEQVLARLAEQRYPGVETDKALARMGREQLWDDLSEEPLEYAGFVAAKVWRLGAFGPRDVMREPGWKLLHWALVGFGLLGLAVLAARRRWEALLLATIFVAIAAISALLVASPRRMLVMLPLVAALAGVAIAHLKDRLTT
ncbi:MAG TPA: glycosyltransferase family 39 protein [Solirubrobacterales bacterium]|nr:glycosyltransferase family 39 protein [Solirubrobacterales bacterium]